MATAPHGGSTGPDAGALAGTLAALAREAIADCHGARLVEAALAEREERYLVVGAGKAVGAMAAGAVRALGEAAVLGPLVGRAVEPGLPPALRGALRLGGHPLPDEQSMLSAEALRSALSSLRPELPVLFLLSGGASALLGAPLAGCPLAELRRVTARLLASGAPIAAINTVRRHLGLAAGGRLALAAAGRRVLVLVLSDVVGSDLSAIGSGPLAGDETSRDEALAVLVAAGAGGGEAERLLADTRRADVETPAPGDPRLALVEHRVLADWRWLLERAAERVRRRGMTPVLVEQATEDEVSSLSARYVARAGALSPGEVLVAVGEPTLRLGAHPGQGGRAQQLALEVALRLAQGGAALGGVAFAAVGSDGSDGNTEAAGAVVEAETVERAAARGLDLEGARQRHDAGTVLAALGAQVVTGPTGTNLLDLHLLSAALPR